MPFDGRGGRRASTAPTPQFTLLKYPDATAPVVVADGIEARLIEAEAQLQAARSRRA